LKPGQILRLGQIEMRLEDTSAKAPAAPKKLPDQTMVIPQGVKLGQEPSTTVSFEKSAFSKKSNTGTKIFIGVIIVIVIVVAVLVLHLFHDL
jgi:hypothetical protein